VAVFPAGEAVKDGSLAAAIRKYVGDAFKSWTSTTGRSIRPAILEQTMAKTLHLPWQRIESCEDALPIDCERRNKQAARHHRTLRGEAGAFIGGSARGALGGLESLVDAPRGALSRAGGIQFGTEIGSS
jgi:hypothetical protein